MPFTHLDCRAPRLQFVTGLAQMKFREIIAIITADGWYLARTRGGHRIYSHATKPGCVVVAGKPGDDVPPGLKISILKQAGLR